MGVSGVPEVVGGVNVGFTDFSEFAVAAGLPSGITAFGSGLPTSVSIENTPLTPTFGDEGNYFEMSGQSGSANWAFGLDAFFGIMEQGEILIRFYFNINGVKNRTSLGACMSIEDSSGISGAQSGVFDASVSPVESGGGVFIGGGDAFVGTFDIQESIQDPEWMWFRVRKTNNAGSPSEDDWQVTAWYGDLANEPGSPDGIDPAPQSNTAPRGLFAMGWSQAAAGAIVPQRIAFLSFSDDPETVPPPTGPTGGPLEFPDTVKPTRVSDLWASGALRDKGPQGLIQTRNTKAAGWMFRMTWPLLKVTNFDHQELKTFLYTAWQRGQIFNAKHPLQPGSGLRPNGLGTGTVAINGGGQAVRSDSIITDGWPVSTANVARAGDAIKVDGDSGVYIVTATASSDGSGVATLEITPPLRKSPADDAAVQTTDIFFRVAVSDRSQLEPSRHPQSTQGPAVTFMEALN